MFNQFIALLLPFTPKFIVKFFSGRYIAGEKVEDAIQICKGLQDQGFLTTLDILGESVTTLEQAATAKNEYLALLDTIIASGIEKNVSLKPTALGLAIDENIGIQNITEIVMRAHELGIFIRIDMENSPFTDITLKLYLDLKKTYSNIGTVIQAYMKRSFKDVQNIIENDGNLRICKGIYKESPAIAFQKREEVQDYFMKLIEEMLRHKTYVGIATHDDVLFERSIKLIEDADIFKENFEFQALLGVPVLNQLHALKDKGFKVRIYVPYGKEWFCLFNTTSQRKSQYRRASFRKYF